jgi:hypothetical protein
VPGRNRLARVGDHFPAMACISGVGFHWSGGNGLADVKFLVGL